MSGRPLGEEGRKEFVRDMNHKSNLRVKSSRSNIILDERRDARIAAAFIKKDAIKGKTTARRAYQAYKSACKFTTMKHFARVLGNMPVLNPENRRIHKLRNHGKCSGKSSHAK